MSHAILRTDKLHGTDSVADQVVIRYQVSNADTAIDNANVVKVGAILSGEREVRVATAPAAGDKLSDIALVAGVEMIYDESIHHSFAEFENEAGKNVRAFRLRSGDQFAATIDAFGGRTTLASVVIGDIAELQAGTKIKLVASATSTSTTIGKVIAKEGNYIVIEVA